MSELKAISGNEIREDIDYNTKGVDPEDKEWRKYGKELCDTLYYRKSEADKVIADLEERHKKEVGQLLIEIAELERNVDNWTDSYEISRKINAELEVENRKLKERFIELQDTAIELDKQLTETRKQLRHQKYMRCLAMAEMCKARYDEEDAKVNGRGASWDYISDEMKYWERWRNRWLELAEKFKDKEATK